MENTKTRVNLQERAEALKKLAEKLPGKKIALSFNQSFFIERNDHYTLNAYKGVTEVTFKAGWKAYPTLINIKAGVLRVLDENGKDISEQFGGPANMGTQRRRTPLVNAQGRFRKEDSLDKSLKKLLDELDEKLVVSRIQSAGLSYTALQRLLRFEKAGENPSYQPRRAIVEVMTKMLESTVVPPTELEAGRMEDEAEESAARHA